MKKIVCITGTRPQLIKHAVLAKVLQQQFAIESLYTGQHYTYELHEGLKKELFANSHFHNLLLELAEPAKRLSEMLQKIAIFLEDHRPDVVLVYGDTDTTLAGALAANKLQLPLVHVEAGERSYNRAMPEEHNRVLTDAVSDILFCASEVAQENLYKEANRGKIIYSGDLMKDLLIQSAQLFQTPILDEPYIFCTIHRNYTNQNEAKLRELLAALSAMPYKIIFPLHPATQASIKKIEATETGLSNIRFLAPVSYAESIRYQKFAEAVITDSGGIQKEAYWLKRRCITIRKETEWVNTLEGHWNQLVYDDLSKLPVLMNTPLVMYDTALYGDGHAATNITNHLIHLIK
jgi:UDP-GlcNAc3NAcA epimerase